jgi:hypothetical protein
LLLLVAQFMEGEALRVSFAEQGFTLVLKSSRYSALRGGGTAGRSEPKTVEPEVWWTGLSPAERIFVAELADIFLLLERDQNEYLEISRTTRGVQATRLMRLRGAVGGQAATN